MISHDSYCYFSKQDGNELSIPVYSFNTIVIGTGCAAYNCADSLVDFGQKDVAIVTEGVNMGTSRNTGSDKQTYYKLSLASSTSDSVYAMAKELFSGGSVNGDIALVESALSARSFFKLVNIGVPFPHDQFGQYVGYKTDHDTSQRATSCGPLTSKLMTECLERSVNNKQVPIFDGYRIVALLTDEADNEKKVVGVLAMNVNNMDENYGATLFRCTNVVYATGGPSAVYYRSVYPPSQTCSHGAAFLSGAKGINVTEWQYGIASTKFRWNLSGTYQQVLPRYISTNEDGSDEKEFLKEYFSSTGEMLSAIFLKGYQWPFDPRKLNKGNSSIIDIAVYIETNIRKRKVFLDYMSNPSPLEEDVEFSFDVLSEEAYSYLEKSGVIFGTPIERLLKMNKPAYMLYKNNGIDLSQERLEIAVCSQHNNGGLLVDMWWQSNIKHLFPVGEVSGTFGVYRPGGTALNSTQVGSLRAAQYISKCYTQDPMPIKEFELVAQSVLSEFYNTCEKLMVWDKKKKSPAILRKEYGQDMDRNAAFIRKKDEMAKQIELCIQRITKFTDETLVRNSNELLDAFINKDILTTQLVYLNAMSKYIEDGGLSRGSYLIDDGSIDYSNCAEAGVIAPLDKGARDGLVQEVTLDPTTCTVTVENKPVRPIPSDDSWFEIVYNDYLNDEIIGRKNENGA